VGFLEERTNLAGKLAVVVGGGGGLGQACALDLGRAGVRLALCDRDADALDATLGHLADLGAEATGEVFDAREPDTLGAFFERVERRGDGRLDVLVNVVGGTFTQNFEESTPKGWDALVRTNFTWVLTAVQRAIPMMRKAGGGSIVNLTSIEAHRAAPGYAVYAAMKAGLASLTRTLAVELGPDGIRVNAIAADVVPTRSMAQLVPEESAAWELQQRIAIPMGRCGTYEDVGGCALFLASDLSAYVTGQTLHPDGGAIASSGWFNWPGHGYLNHPSRPVLDWLVEQGGADGEERREG